MIHQASRTHEPIRVRDQRIAKMPTVSVRQTRKRALTATGLAIVAWAGAAGGRDPYMLVVALGMSVISCLLFRMSRRVR